MSITDFTLYRDELDDIFFSGRSYLQRETKHHKDFWLFCERYYRYQKNKSPSIPSDGAEGYSKLDLPLKYDKRYRCNFSILFHQNYDHLPRGLNQEKLKEFKQLVHLYEDFNQKQKFAKIRKIKNDQSNLPISQYRSKIITAVQQNQVVIIAGDTGCGKSTQVPQYLLNSGFSHIACTQPRRIACMSLAKRVGYEMLNQYGSRIAYQIRFEESKTRATKVLFLTEGLLLRQLVSDPTLSLYNVIVVDEVHERHVQGDFLLGILKDLLPIRRDLKLILMSATININLFANYFEGAPVIKIPGRLYPIQLEYVSQLTIRESREFGGTADRFDTSPYLKIMQIIDEKYPDNERGDMLIFLSGLSDITALFEDARNYALKTKKWIVLSLHSSLSVEQQEKVFDIVPEGVRKCIISTNIAETSVTIDGVRFIIDSGKVKEMSYDSGAKMHRLQEFWISKASAEQRKGRAGRTGPGVCFRLYSDSEYEAFEQYSTPEIRRISLDSLILQMLLLEIKNPTDFPFIEPPSKAALDHSVISLQDQGVIEKENMKLTVIGKMLANLPVEVVIGKTLIMGTLFKIIPSVVTMAAALAVQSPFYKTVDQGSEIANAREEILSTEGDPFTLLNAYNAWLQVKAEREIPSKKWCRQRGIEEQRFYEMSKLRLQFLDLLQDHHLISEKEVNDKNDPFRKQSIDKKRERKKQLRDLKRKYARDKLGKRKMLRMDGEHAQNVSDDEVKETDFRDAEFRLLYGDHRSRDRKEKKQDDYDEEDPRTVLLHKVVLVSGLYPNIALADECNSWRKENEQIFHAKTKSFVTPHPGSIFAMQPQLLHPQIISNKDESQLANPRSALSSGHQIIAYVSLLETTKPYFVNGIRLPALQTLLLFAKNIKTDRTCTRMIFDNWLEIGLYPDCRRCGKMLILLVQVRNMWNQLLQFHVDKDVLDGKKAKSLDEFQDKLKKKIYRICDDSIRYTIKKYADASNMKRTEQLDSTHVTDKETIESSDTKDLTQVQISDYLEYDSLETTEDRCKSNTLEYLDSRTWSCSLCNTEMKANFVERLKHSSECTILQHSKGLSSSTKSATEQIARRLYKCPVCFEEFNFSAIEILRHKKSHTEQAAEGSSSVISNEGGEDNTLVKSDG
ncbi:putative ATP-dependent RNA helicase DHX34 [Trichoplax sp. H2]|nr:putative ATP-dependent RNA helicase DHX34 [Trichoplax sp. H2]|eukprot:RDD43533.1 putative ATP-dependent RNA helicase DHX34 [Trichoplax sp. H2]